MIEKVSAFPSPQLHIQLTIGKLPNGTVASVKVVLVLTQAPEGFVNPALGPNTFILAVCFIVSLHPFKSVVTNVGLYIPDVKNFLKTIGNVVVIMGDPSPNIHVYV